MSNKSSVEASRYLGTSVNSTILRGHELRDKRPRKSVELEEQADAPEILSTPTSSSRVPFTEKLMGEYATIKHKSPPLSLLSAGSSSQCQIGGSRDSNVVNSRISDLINSERLLLDGASSLFSADSPANLHERNMVELRRSVGKVEAVITELACDVFLVREETVRAHMNRKLERLRKYHSAVAEMIGEMEDTVLPVFPPNSVDLQQIMNARDSAEEGLDDSLESLTARFQTMHRAQFENDCLACVDGAFFPFPQGRIATIFVRKSYVDIFNLVMTRIDRGEEIFAVSGTPGTGKSTFFFYMLHRLVEEDPHKFNRVLYQRGNCYFEFDLERRLVRAPETHEARRITHRNETLYVVDGSECKYFESLCATIFISSPRSKNYRRFVNQNCAAELFLPIWTYEEVEKCRNSCYPDISSKIASKRFDVYGGVPRMVFWLDDAVMPPHMDRALADVRAVEAVRNIGNPTNMYPTAHILFHIVVSDQYKVERVDLASKYVANRLFEKYFIELMTNLSNFFGGDQSCIGGKFFEMYGNLVFSLGGRALRARCLEDNTAFDIQLWSFDAPRNSFGINHLPAKPLEGYYAATDENFPGVDAMSAQGMFQFTISADHPIRGVETLWKLRKYYEEPKLYFVVPSNRFVKFRKQEFLATKGNTLVQPIDNLKQYVIELPVFKHFLKKSHV